MRTQHREYLPRLIDGELAELLAGLPAVAVEGAKGVGKTVTASRWADRVVRLDVEPEREAFASHPFDFVPTGTLLLDEWQRFPESWDRVRRAVDAGAPPGSFILTGSAPPPGAKIHSGAGRIVVRRLRPMSLAERGVAQPAVSLAALATGTQPSISGQTDVTLTRYAEEIFASGLPGVRHLPPALRDEHLDGYVAAGVQREFAEQGVTVRRPQSLMAWLRAYAAATATTASYTTILDAATGGVDAKPARDTTLVYRDVLARAFLVDPIEPWIPVFRPLHRMAQAPKHFLADPALAARLLGLEPGALVTGTDTVRSAVGPGSMLGPLFEHLVAQSVLTYAQTIGARVSHVRQRDGRHEIDLIVELRGKVVALEIKLAPAIHARDVRHLLWLRQLLPDAVADAAVITTGPYAYRRDDGVAVVPAALLGP
ncbi:MAG: DUF4143 domain-containing protein [Bifidobacteriaceae bacterium]|nr:DUF4143 domain-containing protein [Bifidobacteriaceae bacterium]